MTTIAIDTLATMRKLEKAGFQTEQAEAVAEVVAHQGDDLATKSDLEAVEKSLRQEVAGMERSLRQETTSIRQEVAGLRWMFGLHFALTLVVLGLLFAVWRDVASLTAG